MKKLCILLLTSALMFGSFSIATAEDKAYQVGIIQLVQHEALDAATKGFRDALVEKLGDRITFDEQNASGDISTASTIANTFAASGLDLVMANATPALQAIATATTEIPIMGTSVTDYGTALDISPWTGVTGMNVSGTSDLAPLDGQAAMIHELFPDAKTVGLLYCSAEPNSLFQVEKMEEELEKLGYATQRFPFTDSNDVAAVTETALTADVIFIPTDNTAAAAAETIRNVVEPARKPVVAGEEGICSACGVATLTISYYELGCLTGHMAYDVLVNGADVSTLPVSFVPTFVKKYNAELAAAYGIEVPADYTAIDVQ